MRHAYLCKVSALEETRYLRMYSMKHTHVVQIRTKCVSFTEYIRKYLVSSSAGSTSPHAPCMSATNLNEFSSTKGYAAQATFDACKSS